MKENETKNERKNMTPICYGQIRWTDHAQEKYETASRHAGIRAKELRNAGFRVIVSPLGLQVTSVGTVKLTMLHIIGDTANLPAVRIEKI